MRFGGEPLGLDPQCFTNGAALLFARPHDVTIVPTMGEHRLKGVVKRIHGIGPARRVERALKSTRCALSNCASDNPSGCGPINTGCFRRETERPARSASGPTRTYGHVHFRAAIGAKRTSTRE